MNEKLVASLTRIVGLGAAILVAVLYQNGMIPKEAAYILGAVAVLMAL